MIPIDALMGHLLHSVKEVPDRIKDMRWKWGW